MDRMEEDETIEACKRGDMAAYQRIYERYEQPLLRTACRMLRRQEDAEDAVQETFLKLHRGINGFRSGARFSTYLFRILLNTCYDVLRLRNKAGFEDLDADLLPHYSSHEAEHSLKEAVEALPRQMKACFVLFAVEEFTQDEVARILDISVGSVKVNVHRARQKLRGWLAVSPEGGKA
jgi:RNA polymerase sigma-70 factor (ECF subfamily)